MKICEDGKCVIFANDCFDAGSENTFRLRTYSQWVTIESRNNLMTLESKEDAENLIKALQKAIELGWWQDKPAGVSE